MFWLTFSEASLHFLDSVKLSGNVIDFDLEDLNAICSPKSFHVFIFMQ